MPQPPTPAVTDATILEIAERLYNGRVRFRYGNDPSVPTWHEEGFFAGETVTPKMRQELTIWEIYSLVADAGWLTNLGRVDECKRQLDFAKEQLNILRAV